MKKILKFIVVLVLIAALIAGGYGCYLFLDYHRLGDMNISVVGNISDTAKTDTEYEILSWNIGFGAYESDYDFFMDGGTQSTARSPERLDTNLDNIAFRLADEKADFYFIQEVDIDSTRSYHVDERIPIISALSGYNFTFAQNYDSPFLFYPLTHPHGASKAGLMVFSKYGVSGAERVELPVENKLTKFLDLDRCYSKNRVPTENGKDLVLYNFHLSAYTSDGTIATEQLEILLAEMQNEYEKGNYCIAGGDFNKDLTGNSEAVFGVDLSQYTWAQPIDDSLFDGLSIKKIVPFHEDTPVASCRNCDLPYVKGNAVLTVDGFLVSENVTVVDTNVIDKQFFSSDHNPVYLKFILEETK